MTMKCNMCETGNMEYITVLSKENEEKVIVPEVGSALDKELTDFIASVGNSSYEGYHITFVYNCEQCPNSQLEWYFIRDSEAYSKLMSGKVERLTNTYQLKKGK